MSDKGFVTELKKEIKIDSIKEKIKSILKNVKLDVNFNSEDKKLNVEVGESSIDATGKIECDFSSENDSKVKVSVSKK